MLTPVQKQVLIDSFLSTKAEWIAEHGEESYQREIVSLGPNVLFDYAVSPETADTPEMRENQKILIANRDECIQIFAILLGYY